MRVLLAVLAAALVSATPAHAQRAYDQAELDALLAPIALQPDGVLSQILIAATYPDEVAAAAAWSRANPHLSGDDAVRAVQNEPWDPSVKALVAFPDLLARMAESPRWMQNLGQAFLAQEPQVMDAVQGLRRRAQAAGYLGNSGQTVVAQEGEAILVQPRAQVVYVPYYDPYVVYGTWWWPHYRPVYWRPWVPHPVVVSHGFFHSKPYWHHRKVYVAHKPVHVQKRTFHKTPEQVHFSTPRLQPQTRPLPIHQTAPASRRMPAASGFTQKQRQFENRQSSRGGQRRG